MNICQITAGMIAYSNGNLRDINHFLKVYALAQTIGQCERLTPFEQECLETAAVLHDIACPLCREKYGTTAAPYQEREGAILARAFLTDRGADSAVTERVVHLIAHHHTPEAADGPDFQILLEADYLVNAGERGDSAESIRGALEQLFKTPTGTALLRSMYL